MKLLFENLPASLAPQRETLARCLEAMNRVMPLRAVYLFGSHAWGTPGPDSDVDLLVVVPASSERPSRRGQRAQVALMDTGIAKDVLVRTRAEIERLRHVPASLTGQILRQGRRIYG